MDSYIRVPDEFSLGVALLANTKNRLEMKVALLSNRTIPAGTTFYPDQGSVRLNKLEIYSQLRPDDVRYKYGCEDTVTTTDDRDERHCNWIRFLKTSNVIDEINLVGMNVKGQAVFQIVKTISPNEEIVAYLQRADDIGHMKEDEILKPKTYTELTADCKVKTEINVTPVSSNPFRRVRDSFTSPPSREDDSNSSTRNGAHFSDGTASPQAITSTPETEHYSDLEYSPHYVTPYPQQMSPLNLTSNRTSKCSLSAVDTSTLISPISSLSLSSKTSSLILSSQASPSETCLQPKRSRERKWLNCEVCGKKFDRPSLLKRHIRIHTGEKPHACDVCGKAFSTSSSLNTHRRIHSGEKPHECAVCGKRFTASSNLYYHKMTHDTEKPHKCHLCSKSFPTPGDLRSHMYVHNGSWPFRCDVCNRGFSKQTNLKNHLRLHTGEKPHECTKCDKKFALFCNLKSHLKTHEDDDQGSCIKCGRTFLKKEVTSDQCYDCLKVPSPIKSPSKRRTLSDFSISKLTMEDNKSPKPKEICDPRMYSMYNPMVLMAPSFSQFVHKPTEHIPYGFAPMFEGISPPESHLMPQATNFASRFHHSVSVEEFPYQAHSSMAPLMPQWTGLAAK